MANREYEDAAPTLVHHDRNTVITDSETKITHRRLRQPDGESERIWLRSEPPKFPNNPLCMLAIETFEVTLCI